MPLTHSAILAGSAEPTEVEHALRVALLAVATLAEMRESDTESHILRVSAYVRVLAFQLQTQPNFADVLTSPAIEQMCRSVPLYDMGSVGIPDRILLKPGRLNADEVAIMRTHPTIGHEALVRAEKTWGKPSALLTVAKELVYCHQEKWDGSGYPRGLSGTQIPVSARIMAIADVYDALISNKVYKDGVPHDKAVQVIFGERGGHFDPDMVDAFIEIQDQFADIAQRFADTDADMQNKIEYMANAIAEQASI